MFLHLKLRLRGQDQISNH